MKRGDTAPNNDAAIDGADRGAQRQSRQDDDWQRIPLPVVEQHGGDHAAEAENHAHREIDAAGEDDEGHPNRDDAKHRRLEEDVPDVRHSQEDR